MRTYRFDPAIGQRFVHRDPGMAESVWVLTAIPQPQGMLDPVLLTLTEELTQRTFLRSPAHIAQEILEGRLVSEQHAPMSAVTTAPLALANLLADMSRGQLRNFKMKAHYVLALERANLGLSHKSSEFVQFIEVAHTLRMTAWKSKAQESPGCAIEPVEAKAPAPTSVYRWCLRYRKAGNDLRVLAHVALVTRTRKARKPREKELLMSFLAGRKASLEKVSIETLTTEFNQLLATSDPLHLDQLIESQYVKGVETAAANKLARTRKKSSMFSKRRKAKNSQRQKTNGSLSVPKADSGVSQ